MATALPPSAILAVRDPTAPRTKPKYAWMEPSTTPAKPKYDWMEPSTTPAKVIESSLISIPTLEDVSTEQASNIVGIQSSALPFAMPIGTGPKPETTSSVQASIDEYGRKRLIVKLKFPASGMSRSFIAAQNANHYRQSQKRDVKKSAKRKPLQEEYEEEYQDDDDSDSEYIPGGAAKRRGTTGRRSRRSKTVKLTLAQKEQQEIEAELVRELDDQIRTAMGATGRKPDVPRTSKL